MSFRTGWMQHGDIVAVESPDIYDIQRADNVAKYHSTVLEAE
jgi:translation initiation factor IF-1